MSSGIERTILSLQGRAPKVLAQIGADHRRPSNAASSGLGPGVSTWPRGSPTSTKAPMAAARRASYGLGPSVSHLKDPSP